MKAFAFLYSATAALDYRFIAGPGAADVPRSVRVRFEKSVKRLLSGERLILEPKWLYIKDVEDDVPYVLWGTACQNSCFSETFAHDRKQRPIQCFVGVLVSRPDERLKLPYKTSAFSSLFNELMGKVWNSLDSAPLVCPVSVVDWESDRFIQRNSESRLNYDPAVCRLFPASFPNVEGLFSEALASRKRVSLASGIEKRSEVIDPDYEPLMNAVSAKDLEDVKDIPVKRPSAVPSATTFLPENNHRSEETKPPTPVRHNRSRCWTRCRLLLLLALLVCLLGLCKLCRSSFVSRIKSEPRLMDGGAKHQNQDSVLSI